MKKIRTAFLLLLLAVLILFAVLSAEPTHEYSGWMLTLCAALLMFTRKQNSLFQRVLFLTIISFVSLRYIVFRSLYTLHFDNNISLVLALILFFAEVYSAVVYFIGIAVNLYPKDRQTPPLPQKLPSVDIFIPTYNEDEDIAMITATACKNLDYPADLVNIYILNDGGRLSILNNPKQQEKAYQRHLSLKQKAKELGVNYLTRENGDKAKAGMINEALLGRAFSDVKQNKEGIFEAGRRVATKGDLVLILDCDHIPTTDFLQKTVGFFAQDEKLFLVQTPHFMINEEPIRKNLDPEHIIPADGYLFYHFVQRSLDRWNAAFFCGSAAILKRSILQENGGLEGDTITEDCETALKLHSKGYNSVFVDKPMVAGLETENFESFIGQKSRWCKGMLQILLLKNPAFIKGLSFMQRLSYLNSCLFWLFPIFRYIFVLAPLVVLYFGINIYNATLWQVLNYALPHLVCSGMVVYYLYPKARGFLFSEILETVQMIYLLPSIISVLISPKKPTFNITPKGLVEDKDYISVRILSFLFLQALVIGGFFRGWYIYEHNPTSSDIIYLTEFWNLFNFVILMSCIGVMWEKKKKHKNYSIPLKEPETVLINDFDAKLVRLSVSEIELTFPNDYVMEEGKEYEIKDQNGSKTKITVVEQKKEKILAKINEPLSKDNIRFVFGNSQRWQNVYHSYVKHFSKIPVGLYILMKSFRNCWSITRSYFKFVFIAFILSGAATSYAATYEQPLNELKHHDYTYFNNVLGSSGIPFYVSPRWNINSAKMVIEYEKTSKLKDENITFAPKFRGKNIPYIRENNKLVLDLPVKNFARGENEVLLSVQIKAPAKNCNLGEEQVILDLKKSYVVMDYQPLPINKKQDLAFSDVFDKYEHTPIKLNMVVENLNLDKLSQLTNFASALAVSVKDREIDLKLGDKALDGYDNIYLPEAKNMADKDFVQNNTLITDFTKIPSSEQNILKQDHIYTFKELGFANYMFKRSKEQKAFVFKIPSQTYLAPNQYVELELDLVSGNYLKEGSKLDVFVNDEKVSEIRLKNTEGQKIEKYKVSFRASLLKKGENKILFFADIKAQDSETNCLENKNEGVFVTLFNNSTLKIPPLGLLVELPNMKYIFNDAYPFVSPMDIYMEKLNNQSAEAVVSFNAYLAQKGGNPFQKLTFYIGKPDYKGKNIIFFAEDKTLPDNILKISQKFIGKRNLQITLQAKDYAQMNNGLALLWQKGDMENINGDTLEADTDNKEIIAYNTAEHKEVNSDVGIDDDLSFLSNNNRVLFNILIFVFLFATAGWMYIILKGLDNENK